MRPLASLLCSATVTFPDDLVLLPSLPCAFNSDRESLQMGSCTLFEEICRSLLYQCFELIWEAEHTKDLFLHFFSLMPTGPLTRAIL